MIGNETDDIIKNLFDSFLQRCQEDLEELMKGSEFVFDSVDLLFYKLHKINRRGWYENYPKWLENKRGTINLKKWW